jgi:D-lactate dehydrogenase
MMSLRSLRIRGASFTLRGMKTAVFSTQSYDKEFMEKAAARSGHELVFYESALKVRSVKLAEGFEAVCVFVNDNLDAQVIHALAGLGVKVIALRCAGFNNVDIAAAVQNNIKVLRVPSYSPHAVAEHALALILTLNRKTHKAYNRVREGNFSLERLTGFELHGKTVGVVGTGKIGAVFARIMQGFGCAILAYDKFQNETLIQSGVQYVKWDQLLKQSDIISLHCPLTPETNRMIHSGTLSQMKPGVMLINTSRGKLIDAEAAIQALKTGQLGYLGIDVYEQEEKLFFKDLSEIIIQDDKIARLMSFPNVLITAHQAFFTDHALSEIANTTIGNLTDYAAGTINRANEVTLEMVK